MSPRSPNSFGVASHSLSRPWNRLFNLNSHPRPMAMLQKRILPPLLKTAWSWRIQIISDRIQSDHPTASCPRNFTLSLPVNHRFASARTVHEDSRRGASVDHGAVENLMPLRRSGHPDTSPLRRSRLRHRARRGHRQAQERKSAMKLLEALGSPSQPAYSLILPKGASIQRGSSSATIARSSFNSLTLASILALAKSLRGRF
jgi:hypothetical protein